MYLFSLLINRSDSISNVRQLDSSSRKVGPAGTLSPAGGHPAAGPFTTATSDVSNAGSDAPPPPIEAQKVWGGRKDLSFWWVVRLIIKFVYIRTCAHKHCGAMQEVLVVKAIELLMPFDGLLAVQVIFLSLLVFAFSNYMF